MVLSDANGTVIKVNPQYCVIYGYSEAELLGKNFAIIFPENARKTANEEYRKIFEQPSPPATYESEIKRKDGRHRFVKSRIDFLYENGKRTAMLSVIEDITKQKQTLQALQKSEQQFRILTENTTDIVMLCESSGQPIYISPVIENITGYMPDEYRQFSAYGNVFPDDREALQSKIQELQQGKNTVKTEYRIFHKSGHIIWLETRLGSVKNANGAIDFLISSSNDITERKKMQSALKERVKELNGLYQLSKIAESPNKSLNEFLHEIVDIIPEAWQYPEICAAQIELDSETIVQTANYQKSDYKLQAIIKSYGRRIGTLSVIYTQQPAASDNQVFLPEEKQLIQAMAEQTGKIIERIRSEEELKKNKQKYQQQLNFTQTLIQHIPIPLFYKDSNGKYLGCNSVFTEFTGKSEAEIVGKTVHELWPSTQSEEYHRRDLELLKSKTPQHYEFEVVNANQQVREVIFDKAVFFDDKNNTAGIIGVYMDITERKKNEQALKERENLYKSMFYDNKSTMLLISPDTGAIVDANHAALHFYGYSHEEITALNITDINILSPEAVKAQMQNAKTNKQNYFVFKHQLANGSIRDVHVYSGEIQFKNQNMLYSIIHDVTAEKQALKALKESEKLFRELFNSMNSGAAIYKVINDGKTGNDYIIRDFNKAAIKSENRSRQEIIGKSIKQVRPSIEEYGIIPLFRKVWKTGKPAYYPPKIYAGDELNKWYENRIFKLITGEIVAIFDDVSERIKAEKEIRRNNERLESLLKITQQHFATIQELLDFSLHEAIRLTDSKIGYIYFYNEEKQEFALNTWSRGVMAECKVMNPETVYRLETTGCWGEAVRQRRPIVINDYAAENEYTKGTPEGHVQLKNFLTIPVFSDNQIVAVTGVANKETDYDSSDIRQLQLLMDNVWNSVQKKQYEKQLITAKEKAEESNQLKLAFLNNISHEFRTPMNGILGFSEMLIKPNRTDKQRQLYVTQIKESAQQLLSIITDTVEISQVQSNSSEIMVEKNNLHLIVKSVFEKMQPFAMKKDLDMRIQMDCSPDMLDLETDPYKVYRILEHIISNAIKFTYEGGIEIYYTRKTNTQLEISVKDTGIGISTEMKTTVFAPFRQVELGLARNYNGNGIGLALAKAYTEMLGGEISLQSELNKGTVVTIKLPVKTVI